MISQPAILASYAAEAGMKFPEDPDRFEEEKEQFPHFFIFCAMQLGAPMPSPTSGWENARVIAAIPEEELKTITAEQIYQRGFQVGNSSAYA